MAVVPKVIYIYSVWINLHIQWDENPNVHLSFFGRNEKADPETHGIARDPRYKLETDQATFEKKNKNRILIYFSISRHTAKLN